VILLTGDNTFEIERELARIVAEFDGAAERLDGAEITLQQLPDLLMGVSLFATKRLVIIRNLSENGTIWNALPDWLTRLSPDIQLVLVDSKPDKRTKTYKAIQKLADIREYKAWGERDEQVARRWVAEEAHRMGMTIDQKSVQVLVQRTGPDQWVLYHALQKLAAVEHVTPEVITDVVDARISENVFEVLDAALRGDIKRVHEMVANISLTDDPYRLFGLLGGQVFQLACLSVADRPVADVAHDVGAHPYALGKLASYAQSLSRREVRAIVAAFADADVRLKTSSIDPWLCVERALLVVAARAA